MADRKTHLIAAATTLFLEEGVGVSTANIAKAAGVSNGTLFNAFATKQTLIDTIYSDAKTAMFAAIPHHSNDPFNRTTVRGNWDGYLTWARQNPEMRRVMHLLLDAGLASDTTQADINAMAAPHAGWLQNALDTGIIRGPSVHFIGQLIFFHLDLVLNEQLDTGDQDLAFEMLCTSIGLNQ